MFKSLRSRPLHFSILSVSSCFSTSSMACLRMLELEDRRIWSSNGTETVWPWALSSVVQFFLRTG